MNKKIDFEEYLKEKHAEDYHGTDDNMPDAFEAWLENLEGGDYIAYADQYGELREMWALQAKGENV